MQGLILSAHFIMHVKSLGNKTSNADGNNTKLVPLFFRPLKVEERHILEGDWKCNGRKLLERNLSC